MESYRGGETPKLGDLVRRVKNYRSGHVIALGWQQPSGISEFTKNRIAVYDGMGRVNWIFPRNLCLLSRDYPYPWSQQSIPPGQVGSHDVEADYGENRS